MISRGWEGGFDHGPFRVWYLLLLTDSCIAVNERWC